MSEERPFISFVKCHKCGCDCGVCHHCGKPACEHCGVSCDCKKDFPDFKKDCNLCKKISEGQCVLIFTKHNNFIIGRVDHISRDCTTLKLQDSISLPSCVICEIVGALFGVPIPLSAQNAANGTICGFLGNFLPFDTFVCCEDIDTITVLDSPSGFWGALGLK